MLHSKATEWTRTDVHPTAQNMQSFLLFVAHSDLPRSQGNRPITVG